MSPWFETKKGRQAARNFLENGRSLQEQMIAFSNGKTDRIRNFTSKELKTATNEYAQCNMIHDATFAVLYKGCFQGTPIYVKKYKFCGLLKEVVNDIVIASQMSIHKSVLKLVGCCLETRIPIAVFECADHGSLQNSRSLQGSLYRTTSRTATTTTTTTQPPLPWKTRLGIAVGVADMVLCLHTAFSRPIIHRHIGAGSVLLDQQNVAKLCDFSLCIPIPDGELRVKDDTWSSFFINAPEHFSTGSSSEKTDVFYYGIFLLELLTGQCPMDLERAMNHEEVMLAEYVKRSVNNTQLGDIVDPRILADAGWPEMKQQIENFGALCMSCVSDSEEDRPEMIFVAKQLRQMELSAPS